MKNLAILLVMIVICVGCTEPAQRIYDPNAPELQFLAVTDPNWARDYGDTKDTRILLNVSVNRGMSLQNRTVLAEVAKRLIALEQRFDPNDPNEVKE